MNMNVTNVAVTSQQDAATSQLDITNQTLPPKPKCKLLQNSTVLKAIVSICMSASVSSNDVMALYAVLLLLLLYIVVTDRWKK